MWNFIKRLIAFRVGQKSAKGAAKLLGFGKLAAVAGLVGGVKAYRRSHRHRHA
jgi:hypothetical protein